MILLSIPPAAFQLKPNTDYFFYVGGPELVFNHQCWCSNKAWANSNSYFEDYGYEMCEQCQLKFKFMLWMIEGEQPW